MPQDRKLSKDNREGDHNLRGSSKFKKDRIGLRGVEISADKKAREKKDDFERELQDSELINRGKPLGGDYQYDL